MAGSSPWCSVSSSGRSSSSSAGRRGGSGCLAHSGRPSLPCPVCRFGPVWFVVRVEEEIMPKIIVNAFLTLDGVMQAPGGPHEDREGGFPHGGWQAPYTEEVVE